MPRTPYDLYVDLLKKTLTFSLWDEPGFPIEAFNSGRSLPKRALIAPLVALVRQGGYSLVQRPPEEAFKDELRSHWPSHAHTMLTRDRLDNIEVCVRTVVEDGVPGDLIETGVWRGGGCIFMRGLLAALGDEERKVLVADSFSGLPAPDVDTYPQDAGSLLHVDPILSVSIEEVKENFRLYGLLDERVVFLQGWFADTLPTAPTRSLAVIRLDGDLYASTWDSLVNLYPKLSIGGFCIVDDYHLPACRQAVEDYRSQVGEDAELVPLSGGGTFWRRVEEHQPS